MIRFFHRAEEILLTLLLTVLTLQVFSEAMLRLFGQGALWLEESVSWNAAWFVLIGASYGVRTGSHIGLTFLTDRIHNPLTKKIIGLTATFICILYTLFFLYSAWLYVYTQYRIGFAMEDIPLPMWVPYTGLIIGFFLLFVRFSAVFFNILFDKTTGFTYSDEAKDSLDAFADGEKEHKA